MAYGEQLLSKVLDANDPAALKRFGVTKDHFPTEVERQVYDFVTEYAETNRGQSPDPVTVASEIDGFTYLPNVETSYEYLVKQLKESAGKREIATLFNGQTIPQQFDSLTPDDFKKWLTDELEKITLRTNVRNKVGTDAKADTERFLSEYRRRKAGESFKIWRSKFPTINREVGGYLSGNLYTWYGRSGRGKSVFTLEEAIESAMQGANVLIWALEMSEFEVLARVYSSVSGREGIITATIDGVDYEAGFESRSLLMGGLSEEFEAGFEVFLKTINEVVPGNIVIRAVDDQGFYDRNVRQLEADILTTKADVVVVDPIYFMDFEANTSKTAGGDVAATSKKLRHLAGRTQTVIHIITQAEEVKDDRDEEGNRELRAPKRAEIRKTKSVLEDATNTFGIDTLDGQGLIEIGKGRNGGEGARVEVLYLPNFGIVREIETGEAAVSQFTQVF